MRVRSSSSRPARGSLARCVLGLALAVLACAHAPGPSDRAGAVPPAYDPGPLLYAGLERSSFHLSMRDGVRIAVDLYLPAGLEPGAKLPAIVWQTRYWRSFALRWPFRWLADEPLDPIPAFVRRGYAWISVDARGSGASFGWRPYPWSPDEVRDGAEIVDWIVAQPWSNGRVGSFGTSYDGTTAEFLVTNRHPALHAAAPRFSLFDVYDDISHPGGVPLVWFTDTWAAFNAELDRNQVPGLLLEEFGWRARALAGVRPVDADADGALLAAALEDHARNWNVAGADFEIVFRDDTNAAGDSVEDFSPHRFVDAVEASGTSVYGWSGWFDGAYARSAIKRHLALGDPRHRLILGPWDHGGGHRVVEGQSLPTQFDHEAELLKLFDRALRDRDTGIERQARVHYYTLVEGRWKAAERWPPPAEAVPFYFGAEHTLSRERPAGATGSDRYRVDPLHGTGDRSRWNSLMGLPVFYPDRAEADRRLLVYDSAPLEHDLEVTGHALVHLHVTSSAEDGAFFVYLEDAAPDGRVTYVTEGLLRALHRELSGDKAPHTEVIPHRSYRRADARPLAPGEPAELVFDLLPVSYLFRAGHAIRIALAGADRDHFATIPADADQRPPVWEVHRSRARPSHVVLPVVPRGPAAAQASPGSLPGAGSRW
jgi:putative CocE/NonD family hydrolase